MKQSHQVIRHARAALNQATASVAQFHACLVVDQTDSTLKYRALGRAWLRDLERMHADLSEQFFELVNGQEDGIAEEGRAFFSSYDAFLDQIRRARLELSHEAVSTQMGQASGEASNARNPEPGKSHANR